MKDVHLLGIRSKTLITKKILDAAPKLQAIGCFCIGVNQVDLSAATAHGVAVFNAPYSNTRSVA
ncbi:MAG: phosphoglycerate dehydrogenase, partial [Ferruginibacter sp.]